MARKSHVNAPREPIVFEPDGEILSAFLQSNGEFDLIQGPIGSGKTDTALMRLFRHASEQPLQRDGRRRSRWAIVRQTFPELKTTTIRSFLDLFPEGKEADGGFGQMMMSPPFTFYMNFGDIEAEFIFLALDKDDDVKKLRSLQLTGIYFNETQYINLLMVTEGLSRCGRYPSVKNGGCNWSGGIADMNAPEILHWAPIMFGKVAAPDHFTPDEVRQHTRPPNWNLFIQPPGLLVLDEGLKKAGLKPINPGDEVEYAVNPTAENLKWLRPDYYPKKIYGSTTQWIDANCRNIAASIMRGKAVHPLFRGENERNSHVAAAPIKFNPELELFVGLDFGLTPAAVFGQTFRGRVVIIGELYAEDVGAISFAPMVKEYMLKRFPEVDPAKVKFFGDPGGDIRGQAEERTAFDIFRQNGMPVVRAPGANRFLGPGGRREVVDNLLTRQVDGYNALLISPDCRMLVAGFSGGYQFKVTNSSFGKFTSTDIVKNQYSHPCFVAGTMVATPDGEVPIEALQVGDMVSTPSGTGRVAAVMNRPVDRLVRVTMSNGRRVVCTPEHPFAVAGVRFVNAEALRYNDLLTAEGESWADPRNIQSKSSTGGGIIDGPARLAITEQTPSSAEPTCTAMCGYSTTGQSRPTITSTTSTATPPTTPSKIWRSCIRAITRCITGSTTALTRPHARLGWPRFALWPRGQGSTPTSVRSSARQPRRALLSACQSLSSALIADGTIPSSGTGRTSSAAAPASTTRGRRPASTTWSVSAFGAGHRSLPTSTSERSTALRVVRVEPLRKLATVYDIEVDHEHVFYAEGALVSNCEIGRAHV